VRILTSELECIAAVTASLTTMSDAKVTSQVVDPS